MQSLLRRQFVFTFGMAIFGGLAITAAYCLAGLHGVEAAVYSVVLCLIPGWLTIFAGDLLKYRNLSAYLVLVGTGLRIVFVLLGLIAISVLRPELGLRGLAVWLVASYLVALALETWIVVAGSAVKVDR